MSTRDFCRASEARDGLEVAAHDLVHAQAHVLDAAGGHHRDVGGGVLGHEGQHFLQRVQRAGELDEDQRRALQQPGTQRQVAVFAGQLREQALRVGLDGPGAGERVLVHAHAAHPGGQGPEGQRAVVVVQDGDPARFGRPAGLGGKVKQQPVRGVERLQVFRLDIGPAAQRLKFQFQRTSTHSVPKFSAVLEPALSVASRSLNCSIASFSSFSATRNVARRGP